MSARPPRLAEIRVECPIFLVTFNTRGRARLLAHPQAHAALRRYASGASERRVYVGRYVLMPDHAHLFVGSAGFDLGQWVRGLKRVMGQAIAHAAPWQTGFHDHLLRSDESYEHKWLYVRDNPVRAGLVERWEDWPYQGEHTRLARW